MVQQTPLLEPIGHVPPAEFEQIYYRQQTVKPWRPDSNSELSENSGRFSSMVEKKRTGAGDCRARAPKQSPNGSCPSRSADQHDVMGRLEELAAMELTHQRFIRNALAEVEARQSR